MSRDPSGRKQRGAEGRHPSRRKMETVATTDQQLTTDQQPAVADRVTERGKGRRDKPRRGE